MNARYYMPEVGRFISPDTIVPEPGNPQSFNRYAYALNNPIKYNDPSGHWFKSVLDLGFIAYDIYDIQQNGLNWVSGASLVADVAGLIVPVATGGGLAVRALAHADDVGDGLRMAGHLGDGAQAIVTASQLSKVGGHSDEAAKLIKTLAEQSTHGSGSRVVIGQKLKEQVMLPRPRKMEAFTMKLLKASGRHLVGMQNWLGLPINSSSRIN